MTQRRQRHAQPSTAGPLRATAADAAFIIFAKAPIAGQVKTRLCPPLTPDEAATLHGSFVLDQLERTKAAIAAFRLPAARIVACAPASTHVFFQIVAERHGVSLLDQEGPDLGARMQAAFVHAFARGYKRVVLVGTDIPSLPLPYYRDAIDLLATHELVLGPAQDGGYYLIGLTKPVPELFHDIPWSTGQVSAVTTERAAASGLTTAYLPAWRDIDTLDDLAALIQDSADDSQRPAGERTFSMRTAGALALIGKRLHHRTASPEGVS